ncbi:MAG: GDSL-type esterase/lipase family protein [Acidobacteriota bacterium]|nr:GDSL-type esterase/lipase family protein [Acidobacteriota bacterium]
MPILLLTACALGRIAPAQESAALTAKDSEQLATHMLQLVESTAVAVPGLVRASEPLKQLAAATLAAMQKTPQNAALAHQFINQIRAYLALSDSIPQSSPLPQAANRQYSELRDELQRMEQHFAATLLNSNAGAQAQEADPADLKRYAEANTKLLPSGKPRAVFLGDSVIDGWRLNEYFVDREFINRGISGQTLLQMLARFPQDVENLRPRAVLILGGTNDIAHGSNPGAIENVFTMLGDLAKAHGIKPLFGSILPVSDYHKNVNPQYEMTASHPPAIIQQVNLWLQEYCRKEGFTYVDFYSRMIDSAGLMQADLSDDGLLPNAKGYRVMSPIALDAMGRVLSGSDQNPPGEQPKRRFRMLSK